ncbi:MAG: hypothetical protein AAGA70_16385 [Pseudomonadota bacterium]
MDTVIELLAALGRWGIASGVLLGFLWWLTTGLEKSDISRRKIQDALNYDQVGAAYRGLLTRALDWLDGRLCVPAELELRPTDARRAWSMRLLSYALVFALAYPTLSLFVRWTFANDGIVGGLPVLAPDDRAVLRFATFGGIVIAFCAFFLGRLSAVLRQRHVLRFVAGGALIAVMAIGVWPNLAAVVVVVAVAVAAGFAGGVVVVVAVAGAVAVAGVGAVAFLIVAVSVSAAADRIAGRPGLPTLLLALLVFIGFGIVWGATELTPDFSATQRGQVLFLSLLPLANGLADFASIGLTRWSLRRGVQGLLPWSSVIDLLGAILIFLALGFGLISFIHFVRPQDGVALLDLGVLFNDLADPQTRGAYWWLLFTLFSTLIPTVLHLVIALIALFTVYPEAARQRIAGWLKLGPEDSVAARGGRFALCIAVTAAIMIPIIAIVELFRWWPFILNSTIGIFETYARAIGAIA